MVPAKNFRLILYSLKCSVWKAKTIFGKPKKRTDKLATDKGHSHQE